MSGEKIDSFYGFHKSVNNQAYQSFLESKVASVFGNNKTLSLDDFLKKENITMNIFQNTNSKNQDQIKKIISNIANLDGDASTVNRNEYKTLLAVLDAEENNNQSSLLMDGKFAVNDESSGIYSLDASDDIKPYYRKIRWQEMDDKELKEEMKKNVQDTLDGKLGGRANKRAKLHDIITTIDIYLSQSKLGKSMNLEEALKICVGDDIVEYNGNNFDEFPSWAPETCPQDASLYFSKTLYGEPCVITVDRFHKECNYYTEHNGKALLSWGEAKMQWSQSIGNR